MFEILYGLAQPESCPHQREELRARAVTVSVLVDDPLGDGDLCTMFTMCPFKLPGPLPKGGRAVDDGVIKVAQEHGHRADSPMVSFV
jgi:hypothetical protein